MELDRSFTAEALRALGDPVRWTIVRYMAEQPELAGSVLDEVLSISRPTISYHIRILTQAGLVDVSKRGRSRYYTLRHDALRSVLDELNTLIPGVRELPADADRAPAAEATDDVAAGSERPAVLPTW